MNKSRILFFIPSVAGGGAERVFVQLSAEFAQRGYDVHLLVVKANEKYRDDIADNVNFHCLNGKSLFSCVPQIARKLDEIAPDVIMSTLFRANAAIALARLLSKSRPPLILREAAVFSLDLQLYNGLTRFIYKTLATWAYRNADEVIALSTPSKNDLVSSCQLKADAIHLIANPSPTDHIAQQANEALLHDWLGNSDVPVICYAGRLEVQKNVGYLLAAFAELTRQHNARLVLLGQGSLAESLKQQAQALGISELVRFEGFQKNPFNFIKSANLFVLPSKWEGFPNALIQSLVLGTPVVATDCPGASSDILEQGKLGGLVPLDNVPAFAQALQSALFEQPINLSAERLAQLKKQYALATIVDAYQAVVTQTLGQQRNGNQS